MFPVHTAVLALPAVVGVLRHVVGSKDLRDRGSRLALPQYADDLLVRVALARVS